MQKLFYLILLIFIFSSCISNKKVVFIQNPNFSKENPTQIDRQKETYRVQTYDILSIQVKSTDLDASDFFNQQFTSGGAGQGSFTESGLFINGYSVSESGKIRLPIIGYLTVKGKTIEEIRLIVQESMDKYLKDANVNVKLVSFKIAVLGEVGRPGHYYIFNEQFTILEAISLAGDISDFGNISNVKLIRQNNEGYEAILVDLRDANLVQSKYYFMKPNDVLYVEPRKGLAFRRNLPLLTTIFAAVSSLILVLNYIGVKP